MITNLSGKNTCRQEIHQNKFTQDQALGKLELHRYQSYKRPLEYQLGSQQTQQQSPKFQLHSQQIYQQSQEFQLPFEDNPLKYFSTGNNPSPQKFHRFNLLLKQNNSDFSVLWRIWFSPFRFNFMSSLDFLIKPDNWQVLKHEFKQPLQQFMNIYLTKIEGKPLYRQLYPGLHELMARVDRVLNYRNVKRKNPVDPNSNLLYSHYLEEIVSINKREGAYFIREDVKEQNQKCDSNQINQTKIKKVPIGEYIASSIFFEGKEGWDDIFFRASVHKNLQEDKKYEKDEQYSQEKSIRDHINRFGLIDQDNISGPSLVHLCCAQYFFVNKSMYKKQLSACPVLLNRELEKLNKSIEGNKDYKQLNETMMDICALLNSGGGVILFNVHKNYFHYQARGEVITISESKKVIQAIQKQLKRITPRITLNQEIVITFVPVAQNLQRIAAEGKPLTLVFIEGVYMLRITVRPKQKNAWKVYFLQRDEKVPIWSGKIINNQRTEIAFSKGQFHRLIKRKFSTYYIKNSDSMDEEEIQMLRKNCSFFSDHQKCLHPFEGCPLNARIINQNNLTDMQLEKSYKYLTLLVAPPSKFQTIKNKLRAKGIDCQVTVKFQKFKFRTANNSAALFHNIRFDKLLSEVAYKKDYEFDKRFILTILVTETLKLTKILSKGDFDSLSGWMDAEYPNEKLILFEWKEGGDSGDSPSEFFLKTESKLSTLFIYFVLSQYKQKSAFKYPRNYEKKTPQQRSKYMKILYERNAKPSK